MTGVITMLLVMKKNVASITSATSRVMLATFFLGSAGPSGRFAVTPDCDAEATLMILLPFGNALYQRQ